MPTYTYNPAPPPLTQEELDALAAEQTAMGGAVPAGGYVAEPVAAPEAALVPAGTAAPPTQTYEYPAAGPQANATPLPTPMPVVPPGGGGLVGEAAATPAPLVGAEAVPSPSASGYYGGLRSSELADSMIPGRTRQSVLSPAADYAATQRPAPAPRMEPYTGPAPPLGTASASYPGGFDAAGQRSLDATYGQGGAESLLRDATTSGLADTASGLVERGRFIRDHLGNALGPFLDEAGYGKQTAGADFAGRLLGLDPTQTDENDMAHQLGRNLYDWGGDLIAEELQQNINTGPADVFLRGAANMLEPPLHALEWLGPRVQAAAPIVGARLRDAPSAIYGALEDIGSAPGMIAPQIASTDVPSFRPGPDEVAADFADRVNQAEEQGAAGNRPGATNAVEATADNIADIRRTWQGTGGTAGITEDMQGMGVEGLRALLANPNTPEPLKQQARVLMGRQAAQQAGLYDGPLITAPDVRGAVGSAADLLSGAVDASRGAPPQPTYIPEAGARMRGAPASLDIPPPPPTDLALGPPAQPAYIPESSARLSGAPVSLPIPTPPTSPQPDLPLVTVGEPQPVPQPDLRTIAAPQTFEPAQPSWQDRARSGWGRAVDAVQGVNVPTPDLPQVDIGLPQWTLTAPPRPTINAPVNLDDLPQITIPRPSSNAPHQLTDARNAVGGAVDAARGALTPTGTITPQAAAGAPVRPPAGPGDYPSTMGDYQSVNYPLEDGTVVPLLSDDGKNASGLVLPDGRTIALDTRLTQDELLTVVDEHYPGAKEQLGKSTVAPVTEPATEKPTSGGKKSGDTVSSGQTVTGSNTGGGTGGGRSSDRGGGSYRGGGYDTGGSGRTSGYRGGASGGYGEGEGTDELDRDFTADDFLERAGGNRIKAQMMANMANARKRRGRIRGLPRQSSSMRDDILRAIQESLAKPPKTRR